MCTGSSGSVQLYGQYCAWHHRKGYCGPNSPQKRCSDTPTSVCSSDLSPSCSQVYGTNFSTHPPLSLHPWGWQAPLRWSWMASLPIKPGDRPPQGLPKGRYHTPVPHPSELGRLWFRDLFCVCKAEIWKLQERRVQLVNKEPLQGWEDLDTRLASSGGRELSAPGGV